MLNDFDHIVIEMGNFSHDVDSYVVERFANFNSQGMGGEVYCGEKDFWREPCYTGSFEKSDYELLFEEFHCKNIPVEPTTVLYMYGELNAIYFWKSSLPPKELNAQSREKLLEF